MPTKTERIKKEAIRLLDQNQDGLRYTQLVKSINKNLADITINTIYDTVWKLHKTIPEYVHKPEKGLFKHTKYREEKEPSSPVIARKIAEEDFYQPFADYLRGELDEVTDVISLGGNRFGLKWGTPDVFGVNKPRGSDIIQYEPEVVSAEIKSDSSGLITAFGQACAYKLFSHKSYIVIPHNSSKSDIDRLESLCIIFGIGLMLFDNRNLDNPGFTIRVRARKHEPDMFYVNKYLKIIENEGYKLF